MKKLTLSWRLPLTVGLLALIFLVQDAATWTAPFGSTQFDGQNFYGKWYWTYLDDYSDVSVYPALQGWYWIPEEEAGEHTWRVVGNGAVTLYLNNEKIFEGQAKSGEILKADVPVMLHAGSNAYRLELIPHPVNGINRFVLALQEPHPVFGWQYLRQSRLYPNEPGSDPSVKNTPKQDQTRVQRAVWAERILLVCLVSWVSIMGFRLRPFIIKHRRVVQFYAATFFLALIPRVIVVLDRAARDPEFYRLLPGTDNYIYLGRAVLSGGYTIAGTLWGPGNILWMTQFQRWFGPELLPIHLTNAILGALACPLLVDVARRVYGWRTAKLTAILAALYPPLIVWQGSSFVEALGTTVLFVLLWFLVVYLEACLPSLSTGRGKGGGVYAVGLGLTLGLSALFRPTPLILSLILPLVLLVLTRSLKLTLWRTLPVALVTIATIYPMTHANYVYGTHAFISANGPQTFHIGNNETSAGDESFSVTYNSVKARGVDRTEAILDGFRDSPQRAVELMLRKLGLTFRTYEDGHLLDMNRSGRTASPFLGALYHRQLFNFSVMAFLGLVGFLLTDYRHRPLAWALPLFVLLFALATALVEAITRLRLPLVLPLMMSGGYALVKLGELVRSTPTVATGGKWGMRGKNLLLASLAALIFLLTMNLFENHLPRPRYFAADALPENTVPMNVTFDNAVRLIGYQEIEHQAYSDGVLAGRLYFARVGEVEKKYTVSVLALMPDGQIIFAGDFPMGYTGYPRIESADWPENRGLRDEYFIELPVYTNEVTGAIALGVRVYSASGTASVTGQGNIRSDGLVILKHFGIVAPSDADLDNATPRAVQVGEIFELVGSQFPAQARAGEAIQISVLWRGLQPTYDTHQRFLILRDSAGTIVHQQDDALIGGHFPSNALLPDQQIRADMPFSLPDTLTAGTYTLAIGVYTWPDVVRLPAYENGARLAEDTIILGEIEVKP